MGSDTPRNSPVDLCQEEETLNLYCEIQKRDAAMRTEVRVGECLKNLGVTGGRRAKKKRELEK